MGIQYGIIGTLLDPFWAGFEVPKKPLMNLVVTARSNNATAAVAHVVSSFCDAVGCTCSLAMGVTVALESIGSYRW